MSQDLATTNQSILATYTPEEKKIITDVVAPGLNETELVFFLTASKKYKLDPIRKQIHAVKRGGKMTIQVGIDGYRAIAARTEQYGGNDDPVFDNEQKPTKASVTVYRFVNGQRCAFTATARWKEYCPTGNQAFMWTKMPHLMLGKVAESLALRKAFPEELSGLYLDEEMEQADRKPVESIDADSLIADIKACKTPEELQKAAQHIAANLAALSDEDRARVQDAGKKRREEFAPKDNISIHAANQQAKRAAKKPKEEPVVKSVDPVTGEIEEEMTEEEKKKLTKELDAKTQKESGITEEEIKKAEKDAQAQGLGI